MSQPGVGIPTIVTGALGSRPCCPQALSCYYPPKKGAKLYVGQGPGLPARCSLGWRLEAAHCSCLTPGWTPQDGPCPSPLPSCQFRESCRRLFSFLIFSFLIYISSWMFWGPCKPLRRGQGPGSGFSKSTIGQMEIKLTNNWSAVTPPPALSCVRTSLSR